MGQEEHMAHIRQAYLHHLELLEFVEEQRAQLRTANRMRQGRQRTGSRTARN